MARVKILDVFLERDWSGHKADEIVTVEDYTAHSMVKKGYGRIITPVEKKKIESAKKPQVETADNPMAAEKAVVTPNADDNAKAKAEAEAKAEGQGKGFKSKK